jgi:parallel beta-helix repeat protein
MGRLIVATIALLLALQAHAAPARGPLVPEDPAAKPCTHPTTQLSGQVTLDPTCIYEQNFKIKISNTTLDCNGAQIKGTDTTQVVVKGEIDNVTVKNCYINSGKGIGVFPPARLDGETDDELRLRSPKNVVLSNLHVTKSTSKGVAIFLHVVGATLKDSIIINNHGPGVYISPYAKKNLVQNNLIKDNGHIEENGLPRIGWYRREGVAIDGASENIIEGNHFDNNAFGGVLLYKNCQEHISTNPDSIPRTEHAHSNVIRGNTFTKQPFGVWVASRQSRDLQQMDCGDPTPYPNPIMIFGFFHPTYSSYKSSYSAMYLPFVSIWPDFAENTTIEDNTFIDIKLGGARIEDDDATVTGNLFIGDFDYIFLGAPFRAKLDNHPVMNAVIKDNSFSSPVHQLFEDHLALIPGEHTGTQLSNNLQACHTPWGTWMHHGAQVKAYKPDGNLPSGCDEQLRTCNDGTLNGSFTDEVCNPADPVDAATPQPDAGLPDSAVTLDVSVTKDSAQNPAADSTSEGGCQLGQGGYPGALAPLLMLLPLLLILVRRRR